MAVGRAVMMMVAVVGMAVEQQQQQTRTVRMRRTCWIVSRKHMPGWLT